MIGLTKIALGQFSKFAPVDLSERSILRNDRFSEIFGGKRILTESKTEKSYIIQSWPDIGDDVSLQYGRSLYSLEFFIRVGVAKLGTSVIEF